MVRADASGGIAGASAVAGDSAFGQSSPFTTSGKARQLCPGTSDVDLLGDLNGIVNLDAKIANGALHLRVAK
jgi:hypothetical protein